MSPKMVLFGSDPGIGQPGYTKKILERFGVACRKPFTTQVDISQSKQRRLNSGPVSIPVGSYESSLSPGNEHWIAINVKGTIDLGIV